MGRETIIYNGKKYHRYPESKRPQHQRYFYRHDKWKTSPVALHRQIWEDTNGPIPEGMEIHHKDHNVNNNCIDNLEPLSAGEHRKQHPMSEEGRQKAAERAKKAGRLKKWQDENPELFKAMARENGKKSGKQHGTSALVEWHKANPELSKQIAKEVGKRNGEKYKGASIKKWRENNPELAEQVYKSNGELGAQQFKKWHKENPGFGAKSLQRWKDENPELAREIARAAGKKSAEARRKKRDGI